MRTAIRCFQLIRKAFEWCVNGIPSTKIGVVYVNNEGGNLRPSSKAAC